MKNLNFSLVKSPGFDDILNSPDVYLTTQTQQKLTKVFPLLIVPSFLTLSMVRVQAQANIKTIFWMISSTKQPN